jgi:hypothetical protein
MFVVKYFNSKTEDEYICDVVENYENLVMYFNTFMKSNPSFKMVQTIPKNPHIGNTIPILHNGAGVEYYIEHYEFVTAPSK